MSLRRFFASPQEAFAHVAPAKAPNSKDSTAITTSIIPYLIIKSNSHPDLISFTSLAMRNGIIHSITTSNDTKTGVAIEVLLYSLILFEISFIIFINQSFLIMNMFITHLIFYLNNTVLYESKIRTPKKEYEFFKLYMNYTIKLSHCQLLYFIFQYFCKLFLATMHKLKVDKQSILPKIF